jgi:hypothetical protein
MFQTKVVEKIKTHFVFNKNRTVYENVENYDRARQATNKHIKVCMLDNKARHFLCDIPA